MEKFKLVQSFMGQTTGFPSGIRNQDKAPFQTQNLEKIISADKQKQSVAATVSAQVSGIKSAR